MTLRALLIGITAAAALCAAAYFNDLVMQQTPMVGNYMPISIFGGLILVLLVLNPALRAVGGKHAPLSGRELAIIVALVLAVGFVPGRGLGHHFTMVLMRPFYDVKTRPAWQEYNVVEMAPRSMLASIDHNENYVLAGFVQGLGEGGEHIAFADVPWYAFRRPFLLWTPLILSITFALLGLSLVVHRQWSDHEQLPYPILIFADALLPEPGRAFGAIFRKRLFLMGLVAVLTVHTNNYVSLWWPTRTIPCQLTFSFQPLLQLMPTFERGGGGSLMTPTLYFTAAGLAYFLATDVSLALGLAPFIYALAAGYFAGYGISFAGGGRQTPNIEGFLFAGSYLGILIMVLYTGRHYYSNVLRRALFLPSRENIEQSAAWGARVFAIGSLAFTLQIVRLGVPWPLALLYTGGTVMIYVVLSRVVAETGVFFIKPYFYPCVMLLGFFGPQAISPHTMLVLLLISAMLLIDPREVSMPYFVLGLRLADMRRAGIGRTAAGSAAAIVIGLAAMLAATLYWQYDIGTATASDGWTQWVPQMPFDGAVAIKQRLEAQGTLATSGTWRGFEWFTVLSPNPPSLIAFFAALTLVLLFAFARLRFARWPIHPVMFVVLSTTMSRTLAFSFLAGCFIKVLVTKYGGVGIYQKLKPLMIGFIAGEMLGGVLPMIIGAVYYFVMGEPAKGFSVLPR